jgi:protease-4
VADARKLDPAHIDQAARGRVFTGTDAKRVGLVDELGGLQLALGIAKAKAGIDETHQIEVRRFPVDNDRWQRLLDRARKLAGIDAKGPQIRAPKEVREALARVGIYSRPGTVRLPPLPPLWR